MKNINFFEFLDIIGCSLEIIRYPNQDNRWTAKIENCEVKEDVILSGSYGNGKNSEQAIINYIPKIRGKHIVINACSEKYRREYDVPKNISL